MIVVDIYVPSINETYDFRLDEHTPIGALKDEIVEVLQKKTVGHTGQDGTPFMLCSYQKQEILSPVKTLYEYGIVNGSRLFIV